MENYQISRRLGRGAQGQVYMVHDNRVQQDFVLKQIECVDERTAEKAFDEAKALSNLKHKFICGYREFFVMWNQSQQSMNVCIVMDFYEMGDLDKLMEKKRQEKKTLDELLIKKWTGQMVDAMIFVHEMKVIHRDLKPSNIFLTTELDVKIGDFGVSTVMGDVRTKTRTVVGSMAWMAPEVLERPYDERSDVWSLACIILELSTCGIMSTKQIRDALMELKQIPQRLEEVLDDLGKVYHTDLGHFLRTMLRRNFQQRPTARDLVEIEFCKQCLNLVRSVYVSKYTRSQVEVYPVDRTSNVPQTISHMVTHAGSVGTMIDCLQHLCSLPEAKAQEISDLEKHIITATMNKYMRHETVQFLSLQYLLRVVDCENQLCSVFFSSKKAVHAICLAMRTYGSSLEVQTLATELLMTLSTVEEVGDAIGSAGGVQDILSALRIFPEDASIATSCCTAIWSLCASEEISAIVTEERGVLDVRNAMDVFKDHIETVEAACSALYSLSLDDKNIAIFVESDVVESILNSLLHHMKDVRIPKVAALTLSSLVEVDDECLYQILGYKDVSSGKGGAQLIADSLRLHMEHAETVGNLVALVMDMSDDSTGYSAEVLLTTDIGEQLKKISKAYAGDSEIRNNSMIAFGRLQDSSPTDLAGVAPGNGRSRRTSATGLPRQDSVARDKATFKDRSRPSTAKSRPQATAYETEDDQ